MTLGDITYNTTSKVWAELNAFCIGNHMILRAIRNKKARVNFSKGNKIARAFESLLTKTAL